MQPTSADGADASNLDPMVPPGAPAAAEPAPQPDHLQRLCEQGQQQLMAMDYLAAEASLVEAEAIALALGDFVTLGRLYFPLQEARRQKRQLCGEGIVRLDLIATGPAEEPDPFAIVEQIPQGQLLVAGWASIEPAVRLRQLIVEHKRYLETFLAAAYSVGDENDPASRVVAIVPTADVELPPAEAGRSGLDDLQKQLPPHTLLLPVVELPTGPTPGTAVTFEQTMSMWERLAAPFLASAKQTPALAARLEAYRRTIEVDYACEKAHQWLASDALAAGRGD